MDTKTKALLTTLQYITDPANGRTEMRQLAQNAICDYYGKPLITVASSPPSAARIAELEARVKELEQASLLQIERLKVWQNKASVARKWANIAEAKLNGLGSNNE